MLRRREPAAGRRVHGDEEQEEGGDQRERQGAPGQRTASPLPARPRPPAGDVDVEEDDAGDVGGREGNRYDGDGEVQDGAARGHPVDEVEEGLEDAGAADRHADGELGDVREVALKVDHVH